MNIIPNTENLLPTVVVIVLTAAIISCFLVWFDSRPKKRRRDLIRMVRALWRR